MLIKSKIINKGIIISGDMIIVPIKDAAASANSLFALPLKITGNNIIEMIIRKITGEFKK